MTRTEEIQQQIDDLTKQKHAVEEAEIALEDGGERSWAELLHGKECRFAHEDQCGWFYESWDNPGYARNHYLEKARKMLAQAKSDDIPPKTLLKMMRIV